MSNLENQSVLHFEFQCQKLLRLYDDTYILLFCIDLSTKPHTLREKIFAGRKFGEFRELASYSRN